MDITYKETWSLYQKEFMLWRKQYPAHAPKIYKIQKNFENLEKEFFKLASNKFKKEEALKILEEAEQQMQKLRKLEFLAAISN